MPRTKGLEVPKMQTVKCPPPLRTTRSNSDPLHNRPPITDRSPRLGPGTGRAYSDPGKKNLGTRIAGLESQLDHAQEELRILKQQLASAEAAKKQAQQELEKKSTVGEEPMKETDVFEVPVQLETSQITLVRAKEEEMNMRVNELENELKESKGNVSELNKKLGEVEGEKRELEIEMKKMRVQTEQWRKAADAAAAILAGGYGVGYLGSPGFADDSDDDFGGGKRKSNLAIKLFGDLWKKKGHK